MPVRTTVACVLAAMAVAAVPAQAQVPADAHERLATLAALEDAHDRGAPVASQSIVALGDDGFDWGDAAIGLGGGLVLALLLGGFAFLLLGQRGGARVAPH